MTKAKIYQGNVSVESDGSMHSGTYETQGNILRVYGPNGGMKNAMINGSNVGVLSKILLLEILHDQHRKKPAPQPTS